jgi:hypothetical protein
MTEPEKTRGTAGPPGGEKDSETAREEEVRSGRPDLKASTPEDKTSKTPPEQVEGLAPDTIEDGDGSYLEPPD